MLSGEKILVTGPTGVVAPPIIRSLAKANDVVAVARFTRPGGVEGLQALGVRCVSLDLATSDLSELDDDFTYVLNLAVVRTDDFDYDLAANAESTAFLMRHCRTAKAFLHCSSTAVYHAYGHHRLVESDPLGDSHRVLKNNNTYSICKIAAEAAARAGSRMWNLPTVIARLNVPYGPNGGLPALHLDWMLSGRPIPVHVDKPNLFNPIHEDDYVAQVPKLLEIASVPATTLNWAGEQLSVEEWCAYLGKLAGVEPQLVYSADTLGSVTTDNTRMHSLIGATQVEWRDGMRRMAELRHPDLALNAV